jgi:S-formylglutathione hydrolase
MANQYNSNQRALRAISFDEGNKDIPEVLSNSNYFSETLTRIKVQHSFEIFDRGHNDKVNERIQSKILPFFSDVLISDN